MRLTDEQVEEASRIAESILASSRKKSNRRITITQDDKDAFGILWGMYHDADTASDGDWISDEERKKISKLNKKIYGK